MFSLRSASLGFCLVPLLSPLALIQPAQAGGGDRCGGTVYQLQVSQSGTTAFDRFRFNLGLDAEAASKAEAMAQMTARLEQLRGQGQVLSSGYLVDGEGQPGGGGLLLLQAGDYSEAEALIQQDPMVLSGGVDWTLQQWRPAVGDLGVI